MQLKKSDRIQVQVNERSYLYRQIQEWMRRNPDIPCHWSQRRFETLIAFNASISSIPLGPSVITDNSTIINDMFKKNEGIVVTADGTSVADPFSFKDIVAFRVEIWDWDTNEAPLHTFLSSLGGSKIQKKIIYSQHVYHLLI